MRITGGNHKGRRIAIARNGTTRYTSGKVREAVFNLMGDVTGCRVLDLFAGAGSFTIEALSRGAASVTAVEKERKTAVLLEKNLKSLSLDKDCVVLNMDVRYAVPMLARQRKVFDLIFVDPPYEMGYIASTMALLKESPVCGPYSTVIFEHSKREGLEEQSDAAHEVKIKRYGDTVLSVVTCER